MEYALYPGEFGQGKLNEMWTRLQGLATTALRSLMAFPKAGSIGAPERTGIVFAESGDSLVEQDAQNEGASAPAEEPRKITIVPQEKVKDIMDRDGVKPEHTRLHGSDAYAPGGSGYNGFSRSGRKTLVVKKERG